MSTCTDPKLTCKYIVHIAFIDLLHDRREPYRKPNASTKQDHRYDCEPCDKPIRFFNAFFFELGCDLQMAYLVWSSGWVDGWMSEWVDEWMSGWSGWVDEWWYGWKMEDGRMEDWSGWSGWSGWVWWVDGVDGVEGVDSVDSVDVWTADKVNNVVKRKELDVLQWRTRRKWWKNCINDNTICIKSITLHAFSKNLS